MNASLYDDEARMRDKMLGHEFPFDEQAWQDMQGLLEHAASNSASSGAAAKPASSWQSLTRLVFWTATALVLSGIRDFKGTNDGKALQGEPYDKLGQLEQTPISPQSAGTTASNKSLDAHSDKDIYKGGREIAPKPEFVKTQVNLNLVQKRLQPREKTHTGSDNPIHEKLEKRDPEFAFQQKTNLQKLSPILNATVAGTPDLMPAGAPDRPEVHPTAPAELSNVKKEENLQEIDHQNFEKQGRFVSSLGDPPPTAFVAKPTEGAAFEPLSTSEPHPVVQDAPDTGVLPEATRKKPAKIDFNWGWHFGVGLAAVDYDKLRIGAPLHFGLFSKWTRNKDWSLRFHLTGKWVQGYRFEAKIYDYNTNNSPFHMLNADQLVFIEMPLLLEKNRRRHSWFAGVKPAFNFALKPKVQRFGATAYHPELDVHDGLRDFDLGLTLGWQYRLSPRIAIDLRYNQGLFDLSFDNFFKSKEYHLNSDFQVSILQYWR